MGVKLWTRDEWGAQPAALSRFSNPEFIFVHHTVGVSLGADSSDDWVRNIDRQHRAQGWAGIGYSWLFDDFGNIFEGRGWGVIGAHTYMYNSRGHGLAYMGDGRRVVSELALDSLAYLVAEHDRRYGQKPIKGHCDVFPTECCGSWLYQAKNDIRRRPVPSLSTKEAATVADVLNNPVDACRAPGGGVWTVGRDGGVGATDGAPFFGSYPGLKPEHRQGEGRYFIAIEPRGPHSDDGYRIFSNDGHSYDFGPDTRHLLA